MKKTTLGLMTALLSLFALAMVLGVRARADAVVPLPPVTEVDGSMGTCYTFYETDLPPLAHAAGSRWDRFDFRWNVIEDTRGTFSFEPHDLVVNRDRDAGIDVVGILGSTAAWAASDCPVASAARQPSVPGHPPVPRGPTAPDDDLWWRPCPPDHLDRPWDDPANAWGTFVYQTVSHFKDRVHVWEIWNEPDLGDTFWAGTPAEYAQLLRVGYEAAKAADPEATVLFAGLAYWAEPDYAAQVFAALAAMDGAAAHGYYFDVLSLHLYSNVYTIGPVVDALESAMAGTVGPHPIWLTETGVPLWDEHPTRPGVPYLYAATVEEAAAFVVEGYAEARAAGIEKFFFFRLHDDVMGESFGLIRNDRTLRPAYVAYQVAARYLHGENQITGPFGSDLRWVTFWGTPRGKIDVLWNTTGAPITATFSAVLPTATLVDVRGLTRTLAAAGDTFTVPLAAATADQTPDGSLMIGGPPVLLIQADTEPPSSTLHPLPARTYSHTVALTWEVSDAHAGYWYQEVQRARGAQGPWSVAAGWGTTNGLPQTQVALAEGGTWYFRARARDRAGNWEPWPLPGAAGVVSTTIPPTRTVALSLTTYLDANGNGLRDAGEGPPGVTPTLRWRAAAEGTGIVVVTETVAVAWHVTRTVVWGDYVVEALAPDYASCAQEIAVVPGEGVQRVALALGLRPIRRLYLPLLPHHPAGTLLLELLTPAPPAPR